MTHTRREVMALISGALAGTSLGGHALAQGTLLIKGLNA